MTGPEGERGGEPAPRTLRRDIGALVASALVLGGSGVAGLFVVVGLVGALSLNLDGCAFGSIDDPGTGRDSVRFAVEVAPSTGLVDAQAVVVESTAFAPHRVVGITQCLSEAATVPTGVEDCDVDAGQRFAADGEGRLAALVAVDRVITVDGVAHDCAAAAERCVLVASDATDYSLSGGQPLTFASDLPSVELVARVGTRPQSVLLPGELSPAGPLPAGSPLRATATGFVPGEPVIVALCDAGVLTVGPESTCDPLDTGAIVALMARDVGSVDLLADADGAVTVTTDVPATVVPWNASGATSGTDCSTEPGACVLVLAAAADTQRSAVIPLTVAP